MQAQKALVVVLDRWGYSQKRAQKYIQKQMINMRQMLPGADRPSCIVSI